MKAPAAGQRAGVQPLPRSVRLAFPVVDCVLRFLFSLGSQRVTGSRYQPCNRATLANTDHHCRAAPCVPLVDPDVLRRTGHKQNVVPPNSKLFYGSFGVRGDEERTCRISLGTSSSARYFSPPARIHHGPSKAHVANMSGFKGIAKGGWHPKGKDGGKESWRGDFKGVNAVAGWIGKGKDPNQEAREHQSAPLSMLKDPTSFGPPPKHIHYHGAAAANATSSRTPDRTGLGAPLSQEEDPAQQRLQAARGAQARVEEEANKQPRGAYRVDTTGLSTTDLPKPPVFRPGQAAPLPSVNEAAKPKPKPKLPPRLPPRQNSHPDAYSQPPPPPYTKDPSDTGLLNQGALDRLGKAGVSAPALNIGRNASPPVPPRQTSSPSNSPVLPPVAGNRGPQLNELQSRFAKMSTSPTERQPPAAETSWAEKQAALKTANSLRNDPSKVSLSDVRNAASTANNFRERHGEQAAAGLRAANNLNQKYGIADRVNDYASPASPPPQTPTPSSPGGAGKRPPPPPRPKKKELTPNSSEPPPLPLASKPKF